MGSRIPIADEHMYLGFILDRDCLGHLHLRRSLATWRQAFDSLLSAGISRNIPHMFMATVTPTRVIPKALHGIGLYWLGWRGEVPE